MERKLSQRVMMRLIKAANVFLVSSSFAVVWSRYYAERMAAPFFSKGNMLIVGIFMLLYFLMGRVYDAFVVSVARIAEIIYSQVLSELAANAILYMVMILLYKGLPPILPLLVSMAVEMCFSVLWAVFAHHYYYSITPSQKTVIVYYYLRSMDRMIQDYGMDIKFNVIGKIQATRPKDEIFSLINQADVVFLCGVPSHERNKILKYCVAKGIRVYMNARVGDTLSSGAKPVHMCNLPLLQVDRYSPNPELLFVKRLFDIVSSAIAIVLLSPAMLATAIAIKAYDGGPVFYKQCRLTKNGREFNILKFRSMRIDAEKDGVARLACENDDRITPVGKFIRKVRLDELPQLINIFKGEMSVVGPRPERPEIAKQYEKNLPEFALRLQVKAGLTGLAQVYGKYNTTPYDKLQMDLMYIAKPGIAADLRIILATVKILLIPDSTQGIETWQTTAEQTTKPIQQAGSLPVEESIHVANW